MNPAPKKGNIFLNIIKWVLIILFFPLSLLFVAYFKQRKQTYNYELEEKKEAK